MGINCSRRALGGAMSAGSSVSEDSLSAS